MDVACSRHEPLPEVACRLIFDLIFKGCPKGCGLAVDVLKGVIENCSSQLWDTTCHAPGEPNHSNKLESSLDWVPSDDEFLQVRFLPMCSLATRVVPAVRQHTACGAVQKPAGQFSSSLPLLNVDLVS